MMAFSRTCTYHKRAHTGFGWTSSDISICTTLIYLVCTTVGRKQLPRRTPLGCYRLRGKPLRSQCSCIAYCVEMDAPAASRAAAWLIYLDRRAATASGLCA